MSSGDRIDAHIGPRGSLEVLSQQEVLALTGNQHSKVLFELFRNCSLAVLNTGSESDDAEEIFAEYADFEIEIARRTRGLKLVIRNAPNSAFVEGRMVEGIRQHMFAVLRDIVYMGTDINNPNLFDLNSTDGITDAVFHILKRARVLDPDLQPKLVVCWGGHAIARHEYDYTKEVGYHMGLRSFDICTGCGPGAMKGPMKGASVGHAKQRVEQPRYIGLTEPGIIAAEPPNPMVSHLVILPDIEKRLEAFVRLAHGFVVFPGGVGTVEEILYLLGILTDPVNKGQNMPLIFTGPATSAEYFKSMDAFLQLALGEEITEYYEIIIGDAREVGRSLSRHLRKVKRARRRDGDAYYFNWLMRIPAEHQEPFEVTHESVAALRLNNTMPLHELLVNLRRAFSAIVAGNVKEQGIHLIKQHGPFKLHCAAELAQAVDALLRDFVADGRMKLAAGSYEPCYQVQKV